jgi:heme/copper-type cytochrome/quinol oxidase subunit 3
MSNSVLGMIFLLATEFMFFAGLISAFVVNSATRGIWPPIGQPRLPVEITGVNTVILLLSAFTIMWALRQFNRYEKIQLAYRWVAVTMILGLTFVSIQGYEWVKLIGFGLTTKSGLYGAFFYTIVGIHGAHVLAGIIILYWLLRTVRRTTSVERTKDLVRACSLYWYFVVFIWPVLYVLVYLY